ncbi:cell division protein DamX [Pseudoalteromonas sp. J010]|uniref:AAA family ATPase n=1 Tax=Pseudoalteromonas sp. J010 TaxID=998465 RepID=UPI000F649016|nr:AAA family ATPase [Pseudoalteromonas sp. J010]RRS08755.1 cell division protein DamX [Pseudoalteromonas sp. J010]
MQSQILPSRSALVDRIAMQFDYGQNLITLVGSSGLGKSYLAESFLTDKYPEFNKAFVKLSANTKEFDVIHQLLEHSFRSPLIDQKLSLSENFMLLHDEQPCGPCLWVLDNARHLTEELALQLQKLATTARETIYILATAQQPQLLPGSLDIHIEPLSLLESKRLMTMFYKDLPPDEDPIFNTFVAEARGNPSVLLSWQPESQRLDLRETWSTDRVKTQWQWYIIALCLVLTASMVALVYQQEIKQYWAPTQTNTQSVATALNAQSVFEPSNTSQKESEVPGTTLQEQPPAALNTDEGEIAAVGSILSALMEAEKKEKKMLHNEAQVNQSMEPQDDELKVGTSENTTAIVSAERQPVASEPISGNEWYSNRTDEEWVIQLLAVTEVGIAAAFMAEHNDVVMRQFSVIRNGRTWFVVTSDVYPNLDMAKQAKVELPEALRKGQPFFKRVSKIKQEIAQSLGN